MSEELKPCPYCGDAMPVVSEAGKCYTIECGCGMTGPYGNEPVEVITSWNSLPRHLQWTTETPTKEGHYWFRTIVDPDTGTTGPTDVVYYCPGSDIVRNLPDGMWSGPIPEPKELEND